MEQAVVSRKTARDIMIEAIVWIESLPAMRPRWWAVDAALCVLLFIH